MTEERKAPAIRFKEFSDQNAEAWEQRKLGDISTSFSGGTPAVGNKKILWWGDSFYSIG